MQKKLHSIDYLLYKNLSELPTDLQVLMEHAIQARNQAYAPYSKFMVGAAVLLDNGKIITGNNQENAAFPSGTCAERVAIFYAMATYPTATILKIAITGTSSLQEKNTPTTPCGSCRQAILEYEATKRNPIEILCMGASGEVLVIPSVKDLLPFCFDEFY